MKASSDMTVPLLQFLLPAVPELPGCAERRPLTSELNGALNQPVGWARVAAPEGKIGGYDGLSAAALHHHGVRRDVRAGRKDRCRESRPGFSRRGRAAGDAGGRAASHRGW